MLPKNQSFSHIVTLIIFWFFLNIGLLFFNDVLRSDSPRSWFHNTYDSYPLLRIVQPFFSGVGILYLWTKADNTENTGIAWLSFLAVVFVTFLYTVFVPPSEKQRGESDAVPTKTVCVKDNPTQCIELSFPEER